MRTLAGFASLGVALLLLASAALADEVVLTDGDFLGTTYRTAYATGGASWGSGVSSPGGNPGAYNITYLNLPGTVYVFDIYQAYAHDPGMSGAITAIDFDLDVRYFGGTVAGVAIGAAVQQGGNLYFAPLYSDSLAATSWTALSSLSASAFSGLDASDFGLVDASTNYYASVNPDFSATGGELKFGYIFGRTSVGDLDTHYGADNWTVTLHTQSVPEPGSLLLAGLALSGLTLLGTRSRSTSRKEGGSASASGQSCD